MLGGGGKKARGEGCVKRMKTAVCASAPGACGASDGWARLGSHPFSEHPMSSHSVLSPVVGTDAPDQHLELKKPQELKEMERLPLVRLVRTQGLFEAG